MSEQRILEFKGIGKRFFGIPALKDVNLTLKRGCVTGLIGENGAGKSTLMNILGGLFPPDKGVMLLDGAAYSPNSPQDAEASGVGFIHQELNLFSNLSIAENIFISAFPKKAGLIDKKTIESRSRIAMDRVGLGGLSPWAKIETLVPGERQLVEIAKALVSDANIVIFDEPTTSLTAKETEKLFSIISELKKSGKAIVYISHILGDIKTLCDEIAVLRDGEVTDFDAAAGFSVERMISKMIGREIGNVFPPRTSKPREELIFRTRGLSQSGIVRDINLDLHAGEILGVFGLMGSGRTELMRMIFGLDEYERGEIRINDKKLAPLDTASVIASGIAMVTENRREEGLLMNSSIIENIGLPYLKKYSGRYSRLLNVKALKNESQRIASSLRIKCGSIEKQSAKSLSGGNQQKVVIGKWLFDKPRLLIMDEPTRGIDVGAKYEVYLIMDELAADGSGVIMVSSELNELMGMCDRIIVMSRGEIVGSFSRNEFSEERIMRAAFRVVDLDAERVVS